jgi:hypothetical protein
MSNVYIVQRARENKFGWTPDLTDASRYGSMKIVFETNDKPQFLPGPSIHKARRIMRDFGPEDYLLWPGGGDPVAVMVCAIVAAENSPIVRFLRWERNKEEGVRDRRKGWYMPVSIEIKRSDLDNQSA